MSATRNFKTYNFVTGAVDGTLAYDFSSPAYYPQEEIYETPPARPEKVRAREPLWVNDSVRETARSMVRSKQGFSPLALAGAICVVILIVLTLYTRIQLINISQASTDLEARITELEAEHSKLTVEYESVFNLKDVEEYAVGVLGMQEPGDDQIYYLSGVTSADKAVVISREETDIFSGVYDLLGSFKAYFS